MPKNHRRTFQPCPLPLIRRLAVAFVLLIGRSGLTQGQSGLQRSVRPCCPFLPFRELPRSRPRISFQSSQPRASPAPPLLLPSHSISTCVLRYQRRSPGIKIQLEVPTQSLPTQQKQRKSAHNTRTVTLVRLAEWFMRGSQTQYL
ncbi:hypothetical protein BC939DRAFT_464828, partial [Gamsiella multidivaricata]|uniref:uncharacterized protein n=1 Tax=Gamsiella multidivaricata TaxID=101098 RepID=UPI00221FF438